MTGDVERAARSVTWCPTVPGRKRRTTGSERCGRTGTGRRSGRGRSRTSRRSPGQPTITASTVKVKGDASFERLLFYLLSGNGSSGKQSENETKKKDVSSVKTDDKGNYFD